MLTQKEKDLLCNLPNQTKDELIAKKVKKWHKDDLQDNVWLTNNDVVSAVNYCPTKSRDLAMDILDMFCSYEIYSPNKESNSPGSFMCVVAMPKTWDREVASGKTLPEAICNAVLVALLNPEDFLEVNKRQG